MNAARARSVPVLWRIPFSHYCRKVEWAMTDLGVAYDCVDVPLWKMQYMDRVTPAGTVPVLDTPAGARLTDSHDILHWLDQEHPGRLYPEALDAEVREWESWADAEVGPVVRREAYRTVYAAPGSYFRGQPQKALVAKAAKSVVLNVLKYIKARRFEETDAEAVPHMVERVYRQLQRNNGDGAHDGGSGFLFGERPTAADYTTAALLQPLVPAGRHRGHDALRGWDEVAAYVARMTPPKTSRRRRRRVRAKDLAL